MIAAAARRPMLRFPEFEGDWENSKAGDAFANSRAKGETGLPLYSVTMDRGLVRRDSLERHMHGDAADETNLRAKAGDIVYNMMRMWQGAAGIAEEECMVSPAYVVLSPKDQTSSEFFNFRIENARMLYLLWAFSHGLTSDRLRLYFADFARIPMRQPSHPEQKKIAAFLGVVDAKIAALRDRQAGLERYKRGLMQALFSQRLRFTNPDGTVFPDWEEKRLGEVVSLLKGRAISKSEIVEGGCVQCVRYGEIYTHYQEVIGKPFSRTVFSEQSLLLSEAEDVLVPASGEDRLDMARACCVTRPGIALGGDINVLRGASNGTYLAYILSNACRKAIARLAQGNSVVHLYGRHLETIRMQIPHPDEQQKIADALQAMDAKIQVVANQITQMEAFKKGLLQQMFV